MTVMSRFFRPPPPPPPTVAERIAALATATTDSLIPIALGPDEEALRLAAIRMLPDTDALRVLAGLAPAQESPATPTPPTLRQAAQARLAQFVDHGSLDPATLGAAPAQRDAVLGIVALCKDPTCLPRVLAAIPDPAELLHLAVDSPSSRVRQLAAAAIDDGAQLQELLRQVRGKDKNVYRQIKDRLAARAAIEREAAETARESQAVSDALEQHARRSFDPLYTATVEVLTARWAAITSHPSAEAEARGQQALLRCREVIQAHAQALIRATAEQAATQAQALAARAAAEEARLAAEQAAAAAADACETAAAAEELVRQQAARTEAEQRAADEQMFRQLGGTIRLARDLLQAGNTRKAATLRRTIEAQWPTTTAAPPALTRSLQQLDERLDELRQWKDFAVAPKRLELVEEMESLVGAQDEPKALAARIQAVQQQWRTLNKGIVSPAAEEEERFQRAHRAAFEPCREYFAAQALIRRENLERRKRILERVLAFEASQAEELADRRGILDVLREAPREWRSHGPVDREAAAPVQAQLDAALERLRQLLNDWHSQNAANRQTLIEQARALVACEDVGQAIDGAKRLQAQWRDAGPLPREQDQSLWSEFRELCDAIYKKREDAVTQFAANLQAAKAQAVALCAAIEAAILEAPPTRAEGNAQVLEWRAASDAIGELPGADARALRDRFERGLAKYDGLLAQQGRRDADAALENLFVAANHVRAYERAVDLGAQDAGREALKGAAEQFISAVPRWPAGGLAAIRGALGRAEVASPDDGSRERALRMLCIRGELFGSTPTPAEDEALRREYQMRQLMQSMGQGSQTDERDWNSMLLEWVGIRAIAADPHAAFERRFRHCLAKRPAKSAEDSPFRNHDGTDRVRRERDSGDGRPRRDGRR